MGAPSILWDEAAALDQLKALLVAACPEVPPSDIYRARPAASPGKTGGSGSIVLLPLTALPEDQSPHGGEVDVPQRQRWRVTVTTAAAGAWSVTVLGQTAPYIAGAGKSAADVAAGLRAAVDALAVAATTQAVAAPPASFGILGDVAGASLGVRAVAPAGGAFALEVVDDNVRRAVYNQGLWRVRVMFRETPSVALVPASGVRWRAATLAERVRRWLQASSLPVTPGLAYPYRRDLLQGAPARLSWRQTLAVLSLDEVENGTWTRVVALDLEFQVPLAMTHDVPSLDAMGLAAPVVIP